MDKQIHRSHTPLFLCTQCPWVVTGLLASCFQFISQTFVCFKCWKTQQQLYKYPRFVKLHPLKREPLTASYDEEWEEACLPTTGKWSVLHWCSVWPRLQDRVTLTLDWLVYPDLSRGKKTSHCGCILKDLAEQPGMFSNVNLAAIIPTVVTWCLLSRYQSHNIL